MPDEIRIPVNAKIPKSLHDSILAAVEEERYKDKTACITEALEKLLNNMQEETQDNTEILQEKEIEIQKLQSVIQVKYTEIRELQSVIQSKDTELQNYKIVLQNRENEIQRLQSVIQEAPDRSEFSRLQARSEELERHIQTLKGELEEAKRDKEDLKNTYNNYFLQVQTLINQKAIEAPGEKNKWWKFW